MRPDNFHYGTNAPQLAAGFFTTTGKPSTVAGKAQTSSACVSWKLKTSG